MKDGDSTNEASEKSISKDIQDIADHFEEAIWERIRKETEKYDAFLVDLDKLVQKCGRNNVHFTDYLDVFNDLNEKYKIDKVKRKAPKKMQFRKMLKDKCSL